VTTCREPDAARVKISGTHWKCIEKIRQSISLYFVNLCHYKWGRFDSLDVSHAPGELLFYLLTIEDFTPTNNSLICPWRWTVRASGSRLHCFESMIQEIHKSTIKTFIRISIVHVQRLGY